MIIKKVSVLVMLMMTIDGVISDNPDKKCFPNVRIQNIPSGHIFHKIGKPIVVGHRGNIFQYQENSIEGMKNLIAIGVKGIHMDVRLTKDNNIIVFRDDNLKRMTSENFLVSKLPFSEIKKMNLMTEIKYTDTMVMRYSKSAKIPLLSAALEAVKGEEVLIYIEMGPGNIPPTDPKDRHASLITGQLVAQLIHDMQLENRVVLVSRDPFKLVSALHTNPKLVADWWFGKEIFSPAVGDKMRKEFVDLPGLRDCYVKAAPLSAERFAEFVVESGIVCKSVNCSFVDLDINIYDEPNYFSGRKNKTIDLIKMNYEKDTTFGAFNVYSIQIKNFTDSYNEKLTSLVRNGIQRIITDDVAKTTKLLNRVLKSTSGSNTILHCFCLNCILAIISLIFARCYLGL